MDQLQLHLELLLALKTLLSSPLTPRIAAAAAAAAAAYAKLHPCLNNVFLLLVRYFKAMPSRILAVHNHAARRR